MPRIHINSDAQPLEVQARIHIDEDSLPHNVVERYHIDSETAEVRLVWEYIFSFIFTSDQYGIQTGDDYIVKCSDQ